MNRNVFITCAVTGAGPTAGISPHVPVTPDEIAAGVIEAAEAGAAIAHIHVRDPQTGEASRDLALYRAVVEKVRTSGTDVVLNLTTGMKGSGDRRARRPPAARRRRADLASAEERIAHVEELLPEICTLDCGTMNFAGSAEYAMVNTPGMLRAMATRINELGVRAELEVFDTGHLDSARELIEAGLVGEPVLVQLCTGLRYGVPSDPGMLAMLVNRLPAEAVFSAFSIGPMQLPMVALAAATGGNVRVGLEDNLYLSRGVLATNGQLVERAVRILEAMNVHILGPDEVGLNSLTDRSRGSRGRQKKKRA